MRLYSEGVYDGDCGVFELKIALLRAQKACTVLSRPSPKKQDRMTAFRELRVVFKEIAMHTREV